jgi:hypothetical protein
VEKFCIGHPFSEPWKVVEGSVRLLLTKKPPLAADLSPEPLLALLQEQLLFTFQNSAHIPPFPAPALKILTPCSKNVFGALCFKFFLQHPLRKKKIPRNAGEKN